MFWKLTTVKIVICTVETRSSYSCFYDKTSKIHTKNDKKFSNCVSKTSDGNTRKQYSNAGMGTEKYY